LLSLSLLLLLLLLLLLFLLLLLLLLPPPLPLRLLLRCFEQAAEQEGPSQDTCRFHRNGVFWMKGELFLVWSFWNR